MRPQTHHWVRLDVIVKHFPVFFRGCQRAEEPRQDEGAGGAERGLSRGARQENLHPRSVERGPALRCRLGILAYQLHDGKV